MAAGQRDTKISFYKDAFDRSGDQEVTIDEFLNDILTGRYQEVVTAVRGEKDKEKRNLLKKKLPCVTPSGRFKVRNDNSLKAHSGFLSIDIDNLKNEAEGIKSILIKDPYVYAAFVSVSGNGLCLLVKIDGERHADAYIAFAKYLYDVYQVIVDTSGSNLSRLRYMSYDPFLYITSAPVIFRKYLPKEKPKPVNKVVFVKTEFDAMIREFYDRHINICEDYRDWVSIGYALAREFKAGGEDYFHMLSSQSSKYSYENCSKLYQSVLKTESDEKANRSSVATIYHFAKLNNIKTYSEETKEIIKITTTLKKSGLAAEAIAKNIEDLEGIPIQDTIDIVRQAIEKNVEIKEGNSIVEKIEKWLQYNCKLRRNSITRMIEDDGITLDGTGFNTIFIAAKKAIEKLDYNLFERVILSNNTPTYNPLLDWFKGYEGRAPTGIITELAKTVVTHNQEFAELFIKNWLVGMISSIYGQHSPLMLILAGEKQNTGKTQWFRRLLPRELSDRYYAESKLDAGKDDEILMTQKIIIMDDEMGGKSKTESKRLKDLTSKQMFYLREPYGRGNVSLQRLAVLCGTTNDLNILNDPTGNRRLIPIEVLSIDKEAYNKIDKVDLLLEAHSLYKSGYEWELSDKEIAMLNENTTQMQAYSIEYELIQRYLRLPENSLLGIDLSGTEIKVYLETWSNQRINVNKLGQELKAIGFENRVHKVNGKAKRSYRVILTETERKMAALNVAVPDEPDNPF